MPASAEVVWVYRRGRRQLLDEWRRGERASEFCYGLVPLSDRYRTGFVEDGGPDLLWRVWYPLELLMARRMGMGFALHVPLRHLRTLNRARVVISTVDACGLPLALLKRIGLLRSRLVYISQGLSDRIDRHGRQAWLSKRYRELLLGVDQLVTFSAGAAEGLAAWLGVPRQRIHVLPFGVDCDFWHPTAAEGAVGGFVLSVGSDPGRDYDTLVEAIGDIPLHIVSRQPLSLGGRPNIRRTTAHGFAELRDLYSNARMVVIPLHDRDQPSGQSATLQAMACARAVIVTKTRGWWGEGFLQDGDNCVLVPPGDAARLRQAIQRLWEAPGTCARMGQRARETVVRCFSEARMAMELSRLITALA
jgi:glycosyltransferase involved in cell wall biosynthesis